MDGVYAGSRSLRDERRTHEMIEDLPDPPFTLANFATDKIAFQDKRNG